MDHDNLISELNNILHKKSNYFNPDETKNIINILKHFEDIKGKLTNDIRIDFLEKVMCHHCLFVGYNGCELIANHVEKEFEFVLKQNDTYLYYKCVGFQQRILMLLDKNIQDNILSLFTPKQKLRIYKRLASRYYELDRLNELELYTCQDEIIKLIKKK